MKEAWAEATALGLPIERGGGGLAVLVTRMIPGVRRIIRLRMRLVKPGVPSAGSRLLGLLGRPSVDGYGQLGIHLAPLGLVGAFPAMLGTAVFSRYTVHRKRKE